MAGLIIPDVSKNGAKGVTAKARFDELGDRVRLNVVAGVISDLFNVPHEGVAIWKGRPKALQMERDLCAHVLHEMGVSYSQLAKLFSRTERGIFFCSARWKARLQDDEDYPAIVRQVTKDAREILIEQFSVKGKAA